MRSWTFAGSATFAGSSPRTGQRHMFGGQLVGQALAAASRTVGVPFHSPHSYFPFGVLDSRPVSVVSPLAPETRPPTQHVWFRAAEPLPDDPTVHASALAYATDLYMLATSLRPHGVASADPKIFLVSLDHSVWLHRETWGDDWLLHEQHSTSSSGGRAITFGKVFTRDGVLVANTAQEGVVRRLAM